jgi:hypothetical protein
MYGKFGDMRFPLVSVAAFMFALLSAIIYFFLPLCAGELWFYTLQFGNL